ncbi:MAG: hypothetical protein EHM28_13730 [Spirochaetaceae bacterium]|nr:MAG: hypothetical protein EHM28_13730 [Spirochaetaceae bacterium]
MRNFLTIILFGIALCAWGKPYAFDSNNDGKEDKWYEYANGNISLEKSDMNFDGEVDYLARFDIKGRREYEEMDSNYDGIMDNWYYFANGILETQKIDSNFDEKIDIWIYLAADGYRVKKFERDTDFDGVVDKVKVYGE